MNTKNIIMDTYLVGNVYLPFLSRKTEELGQGRWITCITELE